MKKILKMTIFLTCDIFFGKNATQKNLTRFHSNQRQRKMRVNQSPSIKTQKRSRSTHRYIFFINLYILQIISNCGNSCTYVFLKSWSDQFKIPVQAWLQNFTYFGFINCTFSLWLPDLTRLFIVIWLVKVSAQSNHCRAMGCGRRGCHWSCQVLGEMDVARVWLPVWPVPVPVWPGCIIGNVNTKKKQNKIT